MALSTYHELLDSIGEWLWREDLQVTARDCVVLCEEWVANTLRVPQMETAATVTLTDGAGTLPTDFLETRSAKAGTTHLEWISPELALEKFGAGGTGNFYTIVGSTLTCYSSGATDVTLAYYAKVPALTNAAPTNWLLTRAPSIYLYGSLVHAAPFMGDDARAGNWATLFTSGVNGLMNAGKLSAHIKGRTQRRGATP